MLDFIRLHEPFHSSTNFLFYCICTAGPENFYRFYNYNLTNSFSSNTKAVTFPAEEVEEL